MYENGNIIKSQLNGRVNRVKKIKQEDK